MTGIMTAPNHRSVIFVFVGPPGLGKTATATEFAARTGAERVSPDDFHTVFAVSADAKLGRRAQWSLFNRRVHQLVAGKKIIVIDFPYCSAASREPLESFGAPTFYIAPEAGENGVGFPELALLAAFMAHGRTDRGGPGISLRFSVQCEFPPAAVRYNVFREPPPPQQIPPLETLRQIAFAAEQAGENPLLRPEFLGWRWIAEVPRYTAVEIVDHLLLTGTIQYAIGLAQTADPSAD